jgi:hypothetical protein
MGLELRRVPAGWKHPTKGYGTCQSRAPYKPTCGHFEPLFDQDWPSAMRYWCWRHIKTQVKRWFWYWPTILGWTKKERWYVRWKDDEGRPDPSSYRPYWPERTRTHYQLYETVSEGTPISPVCACIEELAAWCGSHNDVEIWCGTKGMTEADWLRFFVRGGYAPSGVFSPERGYETGVKYMSQAELPESYVADYPNTFVRKGAKMLSCFDALKKWFYKIPVIAWLRGIHAKIHAWNRVVGYLVNWLIAHPAVAYAITGIGFLIGLATGDGWRGAFIGAAVIWTLYFVGEVSGFIRNPRKWWDNLGDMAGPSWVLYHMWRLR